MLILLALLKRLKIRGSVSPTTSDGRHTYKVYTTVGVTTPGVVDDVCKSSEPRMATRTKAVVALEVGVLFGVTLGGHTCRANPCDVMAFT